MQTDIVVDLAWGDCAKGKVTYNLLQENSNQAKPKYTHSVRFNGSGNAGHTIYHKDKKYVTHLIPAGIFFGVRSLIGPGCVVPPQKFLAEIDYLTKEGIDCRDLVKIAYNAHVITDEHVKEDSQDTKIGTTRQGVGPAYRDKYARTGVLVQDIPELKPFLLDFVSEIHDHPNAILICEGAQGFNLDPHFGEYPYVTSSHCTVAAALLNGIPHTSVHDVYGVAKAYDTYVGANSFEPKEEIFEKIREIGDEFGATTGRPRQCNYLNINKLIRAVRVNATNCVVINKMDVLRQLNCWKVLYDGKILDQKNEEGFKSYLTNVLDVVGNKYVIFSYNPQTF